MKIAGQKIEGPNIETIVIPRGNGEPIVFKARAVLDYSDFDKLCPPPQAPVKLLRGGKKIRDTDAPSYKEAQDLYSMRRVAWIVLESLKATEDLEWETVVDDDPDTWPKFEQELKDSGFSMMEIHRIISECLAANCLDQAKLDRARESFLASLRATSEESSSHQDEPSDTPSGEPANVSA